MHCDIFWLFAIEYATLNSQKTFNENLTAEGYHQGGLGAGVTNFSNWSTYNSTNPFIPCGFTNSLGNKTGVKTFTLTAEQAEAYGSEHSESVPSYRGIENPFGHIWKWADGLLCKGDGTKQDFYLSRVGQYASTSTILCKGRLGAAAGYVKAIIGSVQSMAQSSATMVTSFRAMSQAVFYLLLRLSLRGSYRRYYLRAPVGGSAYLGTHDGFAERIVRLWHAASIGSRLCWAKSN